ncbi:MAG: DUF1254 domain-containing protein [Desulfobaccales bacterium]
MGRYLSLGLLLALGFGGLAPGPLEAQSQEKSVPVEVQAVASEVYIYGYPLVLMGVTQRVMTNVPASGAGRAPLNQFVHLRAFPTPEFKEVARPNADTLYSIAWLDLTNGPMVLHVPDTQGRYYLMEILDAWTNVFAPVGKRSTGTQAGDFAISGPAWRGQLPPGVQEIRAPTNLVWIIGRIQTNGQADFAVVNALQEQFTLTPLNSFGRPYTPPSNVPVHPGIDLQTPPVTQVAEMSAATFFTTLAELMKTNPPSPLDAAILVKAAALGLVPGQDFDPGKLGPKAARYLDAAIKKGQAEIAARLNRLGTMENGWFVMRGKIGSYGTDYLTRAAVALFSLGANLPEDALYPAAKVDQNGNPLTGANRYTVHFAPGQTPPVNAFWSITMYNRDGFFVPNPIHRYAIGDRDHLKFNADGSLDLYIQHEAPGKDQEANWLPAPQGPFNLVMRLYWPKTEAIDGTWKPPAVVRLK